MKYYPEIHHRRSIRLKGYDYAQAGAYFVTILVRDREHLLGEVVDGAVQLSKSGEIVDECWKEIPEHFSDVECDAYAIMPNHIHGVLVVRGVGARHASPLQRHPLRVSNRPTGPKPSSVGAIVGSFKSAATNRINRFRRTVGFVVWQRNYYEHVIRDEESLNKIREYIIHNPLRWEFDRENIGGKPDGAEQNFWKDFGQNQK
jgi:REP element-mobilizing transposase RayT